MRTIHSLIWAGFGLLVLGAGGGAAFPARLFPDAVVGGDNLGFSSVSGDFNGDGHPDLLESITTGGLETFILRIAVHLGRGDGTFSLPDLPPDPGEPPPFPGSISERYPCAVPMDPVGSIVYAADLDADGADDLLALAPEQVLVLRSRGDGCFEPARAFDVGTGAAAVTAADFNGDGGLDLAVAFTGWPAHTTWPPPPEVAGGVTILIGDGTGGFGERADLVVAGIPYTIAAADLDADGHHDLALVDVRSDEVVIFTGQGGAVFSAGPRIALERDPRSILAGDFNADGRDDLVIRHASSEILYLLLSQPDGSLAVTILSVATGQPGDPPPELPSYLAQPPDRAPLAGGDFNRDGRLDLAVPGLQGGIAILLGRGDGTFDPARVAGNVSYSRVVSVRDFDGDETPDLAAADYANPVLLHGNGDGSFGGGLRVAAGDDPRALAVADFNGDGRPDLAVANANSDDVSILLGAGRGFIPQRRYQAGFSPASIAAADLNGDGIADLAVANSGSGDVSVLLGSGDGSFTSLERVPVGFLPGALLVSDAEGDGRADLLVLNLDPDASSPFMGRLTFLPGRGDGSFGQAFHFPLEGHPRALAGGDFNGDGLLDLAVASDCAFLVILPPALPQPPRPGPNPRLLSAAGSADPPCRGLIHVLIGTGTGSFELNQRIESFRPIVSIAVADLHADGILDLIHVEESISSFALVSGGLGDGTFVPSADLYPLYPHLAGSQRPAGRPSALPGMIATADFDGDGLLDAAFVNRRKSDVSVLAGDGTGLPGFEGRYLAGSFAVAVAAADFDGDRRIDLALANEGSGDVTLLFNQGPFPLRVVAIDLKPGDATNVLSPRAAGTVPVAILGEEEFDAATVDPETIRLSGASVKREGPEGRWLCRPNDVNQDGIPDLLCHVLSREMALDPTQPIVVLEARAFDGTPLRGEDTVRLAGRR